MTRHPALKPKPSTDSQPPAGRRARSGSGPWRFDLTGPRRRPSVLLVDDDDDVRALFAWCMRAAGWIVQEAANGEQALLRAVGSEPDIIVLDLSMPEMDGFEMLRVLAQSSSLSFVPVVVCTACRGPEVDAALEEAGCVAIVAKPCDADVLRDVVDSVLARRCAGAP